MDELSCPRCKTTKYRNPQLKLLVNVCGHAICDNCVELLFVKGSANCPECGAALRRSNFRLQLFEDSSVEKEVDIRKRILKDYNKKEEDFMSLREYNDYLEEIESIIFNIAYEIDVTETKKKIESYKKENRESIIRNKLKIGRDEAELDDIIDMEKNLNDEITQQQALAEKQLKLNKLKKKEELIDELMFSDMSASDIMESHSKKLDSAINEASAIPVVAATKFSTGINFKTKSSFLPVPKRKQQPLYSYVERTIEFNGPTPPSFDDLKSDGYLVHIRSTNDAEQGGGFTTHISCHRAIQEAFSGLFLSK